MINPAELTAQISGQARERCLQSHDTPDHDLIVALAPACREGRSGAALLMDELGLDCAQVRAWFQRRAGEPYTHLVVDGAVAASWQTALAAAIRRCYLADARVLERQNKTHQDASTVIAAAFPDAGSTMAGDFGEILTYIYQASELDGQTAVGVKKWRLKQDRTKPAPLSDVVHFVLPSWPRASAADRVVCAEVKTKATDGDFEPIASAIAGCKMDQTSRLSRTLVWLRERAVLADDTGLTLAQIDRFLKPLEHPRSARVFRAVVVVCASLTEKTLTNLPAALPKKAPLIVIEVPNLRQVYSDAFAAAQATSVLPATALNKPRRTR